MKNRHVILNLLAMAGFALSPISQAVVPAPDGGYAGFNTAEGQNALLNLTTGVGNTAVGWFSLWSNTDGSFNTGVGAGTLLFNVGDQSTGEGTKNTAIGTVALFNNTTGFYNTANGALALFNNAAGDSNTATGTSALFSNTTGNSNTANGSFALTNNVGDGNTAVGDSALLGNTTANDNTATGFAALFANTTGGDNTANGGIALYSNTTGGENTATGFAALLSNASGGDNTANGEFALSSNIVGSSNTAIGANALRNTTSGANTAVGAGAGQNVTTGSFNVYIGTGVDGVADEVGHTYIANIASTQQNLSVVTVDLATGLLGHESSSRRYKEDIKPMDSASELLYQLQPVTYRYKKDIDPRQNRDYGLIAEEVAKVDPKLASRDGKGQIESVRYTAINVMLLNEFLKEHVKVQELEKGMAVLTAQFKDQAAQIQKVSDQVALSTARGQRQPVELTCNRRKQQTNRYHEKGKP